MKLNNMFLVVSLSAFLVFFQTSIAIAETIIIVLDASGSMLRPYGGLPNNSPLKRINIARAFINNVIRRASNRRNLRIGLVVFGHRLPHIPKGPSCNDFELMVKPDVMSNRHQQAIRNTVDSIHPRGETPIVAAVQFAARQLPSTGGKIVLVTDFDDTCSDNPCAGLRQLQSQNEDGAGHIELIIGTGQCGQLQKVSSLARCLGIRYECAESPQDTIAPARRVVPPPPPPRSVVNFTFGFLDSDQWPSTVRNPQSTISIAQNNSNIAAIKLNNFRGHTSLKQGTYTSVLKVGGQTKSLDNFTVGLAPKRVTPANFNSSGLLITAESENSAIDVDPNRLRWKLFDRSGRVILDTRFHDSRMSVKLPPGFYQVQLSRGHTHKKTGTISVPFEEVVEESITLPSEGVLTAVVRLKQSRHFKKMMGEVEAPIIQLIDEKSGIEIDKKLQFDKKSIPGGKYKIRAQWGGAIVTEAFTMRPDGEVNINISFFPGQLVVQPLNDDGGEHKRQDTLWTVTSVDSDGPTVAFSGKRLAISLPPGEYKIKAESGRYKYNELITVKANAKKAIKIRPF